MERYQQIKELFQAALDRRADERAAFLDQACAGDRTLRDEVATLLVHCDEAAEFLEGSALSLSSVTLTDDAEELPVGSHLGPYKIQREIGRGGMGAVYLAIRDDDQYQKQVAIKLIRRDASSGFLLSRFRQERQILAGLTHPNIAQLLDGGTTAEGWPYLVMEYVDGLPIDDYCEAQNLSLNQRLQLFRQVCAAVQYAHQNLIVHRDLKPGNILVTHDGTPKLLDFGIAKLLDPAVASEAQTITMLRILTPDYASPEQASGQPVTTASDVYSLGILLYELLTGQRPYHVKQASPQEMLRVICEQEPELPSRNAERGTRKTQSSKQETVAANQNTQGKKRFAFLPRSDFRVLTSALRGDLDNVVLMALRKEPQRRYASVEQFAEDIRRHLAGLPVIARPDTLQYRTAKFIQRNKIAVAAAAFIALTLVAGIIATTWQARLARIERARAEQRFNDVRKLANSFLFEFHDGIEKLPGSTPMRELVVKRALEYLDSLAREASNDSSLQHELATAYERVGNIQSSFGWANKGDTAGALASYRKALAIRERLAATDEAAQLALAAALGKVGQTLIHTHDFSGAADHFRRAQALLEPLLAREPKHADARRQLRNVLTLYGQALGEQEQAEAALNAWRQALQLAEEDVAQNPADPQARRGLAAVLVEIGYQLMGTKDNAEAVTAYRRALAIFEELAAAAPHDPQTRRDLALAYDQLGSALYEAGDLTGELENYRASLKLREELAAADPNNAQARSDLATGYYNLGYALVQKGDATTGIATYQKGVDLIEAVAAANPANARFRGRVVNFYLYFGKLWELLATRTPRDRQRWEAARQWYQRALTAVNEMRAHNLATGSAVVSPERLAENIARCDAALRR